MTDTPNVPALRKLSEWVTNQESLTEGREWLQSAWIVSDGQRFVADRRAEMASGMWSCGTAMCVAGKVALDAGWNPVWSHNIEWSSSVDVTDGNVIRQVDDVAQEILGLTWDQAAELFRGSNDAERIRTLAEEYAGERL